MIRFLKNKVKFMYDFHTDYGNIKKTKSQIFFEGVFMNEFVVLNHEPSLLPKGEWELVFADEFHRFGCLWEEDGYTFFVDGKQCGRKLTESVSHTECFILIGTEVLGAPQRGGGIPGYLQEKGECNIVKDDEFIVDYVRVFDLVK